VYALANNEIIGNYEDNTDRTHILAIDCNSQYSEALSCCRAVSDYKIYLPDK
jgi:hypothetical protein